MLEEKHGNINGVRDNRERNLRTPTLGRDDGIWLFASV
jgi:hypothetical protein